MGEGIDREELLAHREYVQALARRLILDPGRADDVAQDAMLAALEASPERRGPLRAWLTGVVRNLAYRVLRDEERRRRREQRRARPDRTESTADAVGDLHMHREIVDVLLALDEPYRTVLVLHYFEGLAPRDIAARVDRPGATVRSQLHRGIDRMREALDRRYGGDRRIWSAALVPLVFPAKSAAAATTTGAGITGVLLMSTKLKLAGVAVLVLAFASWTLLSAPSRAPERTVRSKTEHATAAKTSEAGPQNAPIGGDERPAAALEPLRVRVVKPDGSAADGATVRLYAGPVRDQPLDGLGMFSPSWFEQDLQAALEAHARATSQRTDREGFAEFQVERTRHQYLHAHLDGFAPAESVASFSRFEGRFHGTTLKLATGHPFEGRVTSTDGKPIAGAAISLEDNRAMQFRGEPKILPGSTATDATGRFRFAAATGGDRSVWVALPGGFRFYVATVRIPDVSSFDFTVEPGGVLTGRVTAADTGRPVAGAQVRLRHAGRPHSYAQAVSNADGVYRIEALPRGRIDGIYAVADGYVTAPRKQDNWLTETIRPGATTTYDLVVVRTATVSGTVRGPQGGLGHVLVEAIYVTPHHREHGRFHTRTDESGAYVLSGLRPAPYLLRASVEGFRDPASRIPLHELGGASHGDTLRTLQPGSHETHDFRMKRAIGGTVEGTVLDDAGSPIQGARVAAGGVAAESDEKGSFILEGCWPDARGAIRASAEGFRTNVAEVGEIVEGQVIRDLVVRLERARQRRIRGRVRPAAGWLPPNCQVVVQYFVERHRLLGQSIAPTRHEVAPDGSFSIDVDETRLKILGLLVEAAAPGVASKPRKLRFADPSHDDVELTLPMTHAASGVVTSADGSPLPHACVAFDVEPESRSLENPRALTPILATTDADGAFTIPRVAAGRHRLRIWARGHVDEHPELNAPNDAPLPVVMERSHSIAGRVVTPEGKPIRGVHLWLQRQSIAEGSQLSGAEARVSQRDGRMHRAWTDLDGRFRVEGLKEGPHIINVGGHSGGPNVMGTRIVGVPAGKTNLRFELRPGFTIHGRVVSSLKRGVPNVYVSAGSTAKGGVQVWRSAMTDAQGAFHIDGLREGEHTLTARVPEGRTYRNITVKGVFAGATDVVIETKEYLSLAGQVRGADGHPAPNVELVAIPDGKPSGRGTQSDARGRFRFDGLEEGRYDIELVGRRHPGKRLVGGKGVQAGATDVEVRFDSGAAIEGVVVDEADRPVHQALVLVTAKAMRGRSWASTDENGRFRITGLPDDGTVDARLSHRAFASQFRRGIAPGTTGLRWTFARGVPTKGRAVDADGKPLAERVLRIRLAGEAKSIQSAKTDAAGHFEVLLLRSKKYVFVCQRVVDGKAQELTSDPIEGGMNDASITMRVR
ncbi:MAG: sigma-70 family RNA polymerase sigma factor [Planctomycetota bacterium]